MASQSLMKIYDLLTYYDTITTIILQSKTLSLSAQFSLTCHFFQ